MLLYIIRLWHNVAADPLEHMLWSALLMCTWLEMGMNQKKWWFVMVCGSRLTTNQKTNCVCLPMLLPGQLGATIATAAAIPLASPGVLQRWRSQLEEPGCHLYSCAHWPHLKILTPPPIKKQKQKERKRLVNLASWSLIDFLIKSICKAITFT